MGTWDEIEGDLVRATKSHHADKCTAAMWLESLPEEGQKAAAKAMANPMHPTTAIFRVLSERSKALNLNTSSSTVFARHRKGSCHCWKAQG